MALRDLPSVDTLVRSLEGEGLPRLLVVDLARDAIDQARKITAAGGTADPHQTADAALQALRSLRHRPVLNATGVLLHTNLGRAPLVPAAADAARAVATSYGNLEFDLDKASRGGRSEYVHRLVCALVGAQAALVVNNNAGALLLALATLGRHHPVAISRGELIEIGGSYRLPELMAASGARMLEIGTTNRTRLADYEQALDDGAGMILKVHPSNYRVVGFTDSVPLDKLVALAHQRNVPLVYDVGSGLLDESAPWLDGPPPRWLRGEPGIRQVLDVGADLVTFSGDKLLGGPQAGIITGTAHLVSELAHHPMARALRIPGPTIAALTVTLEMYADGKGSEIPFWAMASASYDSLERRSEAVLDASHVEAEVVPGASVPGAGSVPGAEVPSPLIKISEPGAAVLWPRLLRATPPIISRRDAGRVVLDLRAISPEDDERLAAALESACRS
ncbi:MAG TPA: L-seryl-tRNA(Sec) selenium transferase [Actinobacteria bacterium]|nr:L-seryl-tRNA(Sec) selenium transferase [bacterium BMS3Bbin01]HDH27109.1 L-seryl-tRNA(Sec) selenium transferase [Actinomycetota bacterium]